MTDTASTYDEDISKNKLFVKIQQDHSILLETATLEKWIICLPRNASIGSPELMSGAKDYILAHILVPDDELPGSHFINLIGDTFEVNNRKLRKTSTSNSSASGGNGEWNILFKELFYTKNYCKVDVWCISSSLMIENAKIWFSEKSIETVEEAKKYLQHVCKLDNFSSYFSGLRSFLEHTTEESITFDLLKGDIHQAAEEIYTEMTDSYLSGNKENIRRSIVLLVLHETYPKCLNAICSINQRKEEEFNRCLVNLSNTTKESLKIPEEYWPVLPVVRKQISLINAYRTPVEKLSCLRKAFEEIKAHGTHQVTTVDDLLSILVFTILKSGFPYWLTMFSYISEFLSFVDKNDKGYNEFILSTMEAAISFVLELKSSTDDYPLPTEIPEKSVFKTKEDFLDYFFNLIERNDDKGVLNVLNIPHSQEQDIFNVIFEKRNYFAKISIEEGSPDLCHPLCNCSECKAKVKDHMPSVNSCNSNGQTGLHIAARNGHPRMVSILLALGLNANLTDVFGYQPLHYAAINGHQNVLLLLLHAKAAINAVTQSGQTALHLSAQYGHSGCVKALVFFADHMKTEIDINRGDSTGNSPLHLAAKWGFKEIVEALLEYGADGQLKNKNGVTACNLAHNNIIKKLFIKDER